MQIENRAGNHRSHFLQRISVLIMVCTVALCMGRAQAEDHVATRLGNPATRFAAPVNSPEDLRSRFRDPALQPDIEEILRQWGWSGRPQDLYRAAQTAEITEVSISVGVVMPFMSSRENGKPVCLRNVTWAGKEPTPAYLFVFTSNGRRYRCITPRACCNFYLEDLGLEPVPALALECTAPAEAFPNRPFEMCLTARNPGTGSAPKVTVRLPLPGIASVVSVGDGGTATQDGIIWELANLPAKAAKKLCVRLSTPAPALFTFDPVATAGTIKPAHLEDPIEVGGEVTYQIRVTNQGSAELTNVRLHFDPPPNEEFVSGDGPTIVHKTEGSVATDPLGTLAPKDKAVWRVIVKATQPGDVRFKVELTSDQLTKPVYQEESTRLY
jgi:uncharacterized repeat protein (TIGR01451 family)